MSINVLRHMIAKILNKENTIRNDHYVYLVDERDDIKIERIEIDDLYTIVTTKSYGRSFYTNVYVDFGDLNPSFCGKENIHPRDIDTICKRYKKNKDKNFVYGYLLSRIMLYDLIVNCYKLNFESFRIYLDNFPIPSKEIVLFFSRLEFPLKITSSLKLLIDKITNKDNILDIVLFKTGFPRFSPIDLEIIFKTHKLTKPFYIYKLTYNLLDNKTYLEYFDICLRGFEGVFENGTIVIFRDKTKNILYELLSRKYEKLEEIDKVRKIVNYYIDIGGNTSIELDEYFSTEEIETFMNNKKTFLN